MDRDRDPRAALLDTLPTGLCIHCRGTIEYANPALLRMTQTPSAAAARGRSILDFVAPAYHAVTRLRMQEMYEQGRWADWLELQFVRADGTTFDAEVVASLIDWAGRSASQVLVTDITRRKQIERARLEAEHRYRLLVDRLPIGVVVHADGRIVYANLAAARLLGAADGRDPVGSDPLLRVHPGWRSAVLDGIRRIYAKEPDPPPMALRLLRYDGSAVDVEITATAIDWDGRPASQVLIVDVEGPRALERRLRETQRREGLELLAGGVAHDFNNVLSVILGNTELAAAALSDGPARAHLADVSSAVTQATQLARQLMCYAGRTAPTVEPLDLPGFLRETSRLLAASVAPNARVELRACSGLPAVMGDATQLRQVLLNLLGNAAEALGPAGGTIRVSAGSADFRTEELRSPWFADNAPSGRYAYFEVSDDGCGMSEEVLGRVFDPCFSTKAAGHGLGLAAARAIVLSHRGVIQVRSAPGEGSTFRVLLQAVDPAPPPVEQTVSTASEPIRR